MKNYICNTTFILSLFLLLSNPSHAQSGSLDLSFGTGGIVSLNTGVKDLGFSLAQQSDGKIVVAGYVFDGTINRFALKRFNTNGTLDLSFDGDGIVSTPVGTSDAYAFSLAIQADGKIVVVGYCKKMVRIEFAVVRYNTDGSLDNSFDSDGIVTTDIGIMDEIARSVAIQSDGKIVVVGDTYDGNYYNFVVVRYNTDGSLDNSFESDGIVITTWGIGHNFAKSVAIQPDGKIVVTGESTPSNFTVLRYNNDGSLDYSFDTDGIAVSKLSSGNNIPNSVAIQSDGKIVIAGNTGVTSVADIMLARYNIDGSIDNSFGVDGFVITNIAASGDLAQSVLVQSDARILVCGSKIIGAKTEMVLVRYNSNGSLDKSFDLDGIVTTGFSAKNAIARSVILQKDGKILVAGYQKDSTADIYSLVLARYNNSIEVGMNNINLPENNVEISPNPFTDNFVLSTDFLMHSATLRVQNCFGQTIRAIKNISGQTITVYRESLSAGVYYYQLTDKNIKIHSGKLVILD